MNEKKTLTISILGKSYSIVTDEREELVDRAASHIDELLKRMVGPSTSPVEIAKKTTFVALQIAVELLKKRQELEELNQQLEAKQQELQVLGDKTAILNDLLKESVA